MSSVDTAAVRGVKELRLALVLYGGVSLAIYMHGTTKEIHRLVRASTPAGPDDASPSERVYRELLAEKADAEQVETRVVVDVIAGTSAGGINGVYLAKALAHDLSQDSLRDLWFDRGDIGELVRGPKWLPWKARLPWVLVTIWRWPALDGDRMSMWLYDALAGMDGTQTSAQATLMPRDHELQLFVTLTDFHGYQRELVIHDPPVIYDQRHRHVMEFRYGDGSDDFRADELDNAALAFAARATSCFPGAFPAVGFRTFEGYLAKTKGVQLDLSPLEERRLFRHYPLARAAARSAFFVDGGVLDNRPFGHVIRAIQQKPAGVEVDRRLLYLEPCPVDPTQSEPAGEPNPILTVLGSVSGIPRNEPILDEILAVGTLNERVRQIRDVIETNWSAVSACVEDTLAGEDLANPPTRLEPDRLADWLDRIHKRSYADAGLSYAMYVRAKVGDVVDTWAGTICRLSRFPEDCSQAALVRTILRSWAADAELFQKTSAEPTETQVAFLRDLDLGYRERTLRFMIAALSWWYDPDDRPEYPLPSRAELDEGKRRLYDELDLLRQAMRGEGKPDELAQQVAGCFGQGEVDRFVHMGPAGFQAYRDAKQADLTQLAAGFRAHLRERFADYRTRVYHTVCDVSAGWHSEARRRFLIRYLGFPFWDALLFPLQSVAGVAERDHVDVVRLSPKDSTLLACPPGAPKLAGTQVHNFGAFFTRAGRERDYLWGRLDAAERLITLLLGHDHDQHRAWCLRAFHAILAEEEALPGAAPLIEQLRAQLR